MAYLVNAPQQYTHQRLTKCVGIVRHWPFFVRGFEFISNYLHYPYTLDVYRRIILKLTKTPSAYVALVTNAEDEPVAFAAAYDSTPIFATQKEYDIPFVYYIPRAVPAVFLLQTHFERFCRAQGVRRYTTTHGAFSKNVQDCHARYGLIRSHMVFKRELR